ncbi:unnamed protein product, partial [Staurois parvus]
SKYKLLNTFSHQQLEQSCDFYQCFSRALVKACRKSFLSALGGCKTLDLFLDSADWPCADHMHSPKKKIKLSMCRMAAVQSVLSGDKTWTFEQEEEQRSHAQT